MKISFIEKDVFFFAKIEIIVQFLAGPVVQT